MWMRWNDTTHIFEMSTNDGASWAVLPLNASVINEGSISISRLPGNLAVKDANNNFSVGQSITGNLAIGANVVGSVNLSVINGLAGSNYSQVILGSDANPALFNLFAFSVGYPTSGDAIGSSGLIRSLGSGGLSISSYANAPIRFHTSGGVERARILPTGELTINNATNTAIGGGMASLQGNSSLGQTGVIIVGQNPVNNMTYAAFYNSGYAVAGSIGQTGATSVVYSSGSDERLKNDKGLATDLTALRALIIHDFNWKIDGQKDRGPFAQEMYKLFPRAIIKGSDDLNEHGNLIKPWMSDNSKIIPDLVVGWQEHDREIAELKRLLNDKSLS